MENDPAEITAAVASRYQSDIIRPLLNAMFKTAIANARCKLNDRQVRMRILQSIRRPDSFCQPNFARSATVGSGDILGNKRATSLR